MAQQNEIGNDVIKIAKESKQSGAIKGTSMRGPPH